MKCNASQRECNALEAERNELDSQLGDLMSIIGNLAVHDSDVAKALPEVSSTLAPDLANRLDSVIKYFANAHKSLPTDAPRPAHEDPWPSQPR
jgi:hypothetical protein